MLKRPGRLRNFFHCEYFMICIRLFLKLFLAITLIITAIPAFAGEGAEGGAENSATSAEQDRIFRFVLLSVASRETLEEIWAPVLADFSRAIGRKVQAAWVKDYPEAIWKMGSGEISMAWMGNKLAMEAVDRTRTSIFAQIVDGSGDFGYNSYLVTRKKDGPESLDDMFRRADRLVFGFGDKHSTSGTLVPEYYLFARENRSPSMFRAIHHSNHEENLAGLAAGKWDVATVSSPAWRRYADMDPEAFSTLRILWTSPLIPSDALLWRDNLDPGLKQRLRGYILAFGREQDGKAPEVLARERSVLGRMSWSGFRASDNSQLRPVRQLVLYKRLEKLKHRASETGTDLSAEILELEKILQDSRAPGNGPLNAAGTSKIN